LSAAARFDTVKPMVSEHIFQRDNFVAVLILDEDTSKFSVTCSPFSQKDSPELENDLRQWARDIVRSWARRIGKLK
jgi:hypothetical protein